MSAPQIDFRPFVDMSAVYDTGLASVAVNDQGQLASQAAYGVSLGWGISGVHSWKHTKVGLDYAGSTSHYPNTGGFDSINQSLMLGISHQFSRRFAFTLSQSAGMVSRNFGVLGLPQTVPFDPSTTQVPTTDYFDNRTIYLSSRAGLTYYMSNRLSFQFSGGAFTTVRRSHALDGGYGATAQGDFQYRLTRRTTVGAFYSYSHYGFTRTSGGTDAQSVAGTFSRQITRRLDVTGYAGLMRVESKFVQTVAIDPAIAALLGITGGSQIVHSISYIPNLSARLSYSFHRGVLYASGGHTITPGNGLFLTSEASMVAAGYGYTGFRHWSFNTNVSYMRAGAVGLISGTYSGTSAVVSLSRPVVRGLHFVSSYAARAYGSPTYANYNRVIVEAQVGIGYSPGDIPMRLW
jgi:hypothetical protein